MVPAFEKGEDECTTNPAPLKRRGLEDEFLCGIGTFFQWQTASFVEGMYIYTVVSI